MDGDVTENEREVSLVGTAIAFAVSLALAIFAVAIAENVALWIRVGFVLSACFFGWLLSLAPSHVRVVIMRWFPWF